jgi:hypothetical protein
MAKCVMAICGRLDCKMNAGGKCLNKIISLDADGKCVCYRKWNDDNPNSKRHPYKDPFVENKNIC